MAEKVNVGLEKIFFNHILNNPEQFHKVEPYFFKTDDIVFIYTILRDEYLVSKKKLVPSPQQILALVKTNDVDNKISNEYIKILLKDDNDKYDEEEYISPRFKAWKIQSAIKNNVLKSIEIIRGLEEVNYDNVVGVAEKVKHLFSELNLIADDDDDLGSDFDDPESHMITMQTKKIPTGFVPMDNILGGGWDPASLNIIMGETNIGKCSDFDTEIQIKNKTSGEKEYIKIGELFNRL